VVLLAELAVLIGVLAVRPLALAALAVFAAVGAAAAVSQGDTVLMPPSS